MEELVTNSNIRVIFVLACCTSDLQPLDLSGNDDFKTNLKECFITTEDCMWMDHQVMD
jgi:hypothetical protein